MVMFRMAHAHSKLIARMSCKGESQSIFSGMEGEAMKGEFQDVCVGLYRLQLPRTPWPQSNLPLRLDGHSIWLWQRPWIELSCGSFELSFLPWEGGCWVVDFSTDKHGLPAKTIQKCWGRQKKTIWSHQKTVQTCSCLDWHANPQTFETWALPEPNN